MREFWFFSFKWWITVPLWHEFWPMAAAGLHIQDQGRLFRMSSGVCQTIKVSEFFLYNIYHVPVKVFFCSCFRDRGMMTCLQILDYAGKEKWNRVPFYWSATILTPLPFSNQIWITALSQWWSYQFMCSYAERNWVSN